VSSVGTGSVAASNCTDEPIQLDHVAERGERVSELKVMGVFILCGELVTLGWGGV
jgi:hypothetical protein